jgi:5-formyltetrahydrofolate cyclo-ligase
MNKHDIRKRMTRERDGIAQEAKARMDARIREALCALPEFVLAQTVLCYASFRSEVETYGILQKAREMDKRIVMPRVFAAKHLLMLYEIMSADELEPGYMGIKEPPAEKEREFTLRDIHLVLIPGVAFDHAGNRLGYGGGYYDILLAAKPESMPVVALAYEEQLVASLPSEPHDVRVDIVVTPERVIRAGTSASRDSGAQDE